MQASRAELSDKQAFNQTCGSLKNEQTVVLGCYTTHDKRIYVYDIRDQKLDGVRETTSAHEMLHAAYDRLSGGEKEHLHQLLAEQRSKIDNERLLGIVEYYEKAEPGALENELHSLFGTEVRTLTPELERYYARYFSDRSAVVSLKEKYEKVFTDLAAAQRTLVQELDALAESVDTRQKQYQVSLNQLNRDIGSFNAWADSGSATQEVFNVRRAALEQRVNILNEERGSIEQDIALYERKKAELDALNVQAADLNKSIDSTLGTVPAL